MIIVKPAIAVKAAINPDNLKPSLHEFRPENGADVAIDTSNQYTHSLSTLQKISRGCQNYAAHYLISSTCWCFSRSQKRYGDSFVTTVAEAVHGMKAPQRRDSRHLTAALTCAGVEKPAKSLNR